MHGNEKQSSTICITSPIFITYTTCQTIPSKAKQWKSNHWHTWTPSKNIDISPQEEYIQKYKSEIWAWLMTLFHVYITTNSTLINVNWCSDHHDHNLKKYTLQFSFPLKGLDSGKRIAWGNIGYFITHRCGI